jgi:hypothetical protein
MRSVENNARRRRAVVALADYDLPNEDEDAVSDLLTDLAHLCHARGWSWADLVRRAGDHFQAERATREGGTEP